MSDVSTSTAVTTGTVSIPVPAIVADKPVKPAKPAVRGSNNPPSLIPPDDKVAKEMARTAFTEDKVGKGKVITATQRIAYACMIHHANAVEADRDIPGLADYFTVKADRATLQAEMCEVLIGDEPDKKTASFDVLDEYKAKKAVVVRGLELCAILAKFACDWTWFDAGMSPPCWAVRPGMLHPEGTKPRGRLDGTERIYLNGKSVIWDKKDAKENDQPGHAYASVAHLLLLHKPKAPKRATGGATSDKATVTEGATFNPKNAASVAQTVDANHLWEALEILLVKDHTGEPIRAIDMTDKSARAYARVMQAMDEARVAKGWLAKVDGKSPSKAAAALARKAA